MQIQRGNNSGFNYSRMNYYLMHCFGIYYQAELPRSLSRGENDLKHRTHNYRGIKNPSPREFLEGPEVWNQY